MSADTADWSSAFLASAGAAAALAGLVFVAVSINITDILAIKGLPERGLQTVIVLIGALVVSTVALAPQRSSNLGIEVFLVGVVLSGWLATSMHTTLSGTRGHARWVVSRFLATTPSGLLYIAAGATMTTTTGRPLLLTGILTALIGGVINAWVLLVEIRR